MEISPAMREDGYDALECDADLARATRINPDAFARLYDRYVTRVYQFLRSRTENPEDAADLTQQVFERALNGICGYDERKASFDAWLFGIARHAAIDAQRRRRGTASWDLLPEILQGSATTADDPEDLVLRREALSYLQTLLAEIGPEKREILWLRFVLGLSVNEVAAVVGKSPAAVHKQINRTLQSLEERYRGR